MSLLRDGADALLSVVLAPSCAACGVSLEAPTRSAACEACWNAIRPLVPPLCSACGDPLPSWRAPDRDPGRCPRCRERQTWVALGRSVGEYDGVLRALVHALKYDGRRSLAAPLSRLMLSHGRVVLEGADVAVPVPLHWSRQWRRGFNQAFELASGLGLPVRRLLRRRRRTHSQADLPADRRHANVCDAFGVPPRTRVDALTIVLVDDVRTTGSTVEACAKVLLESGAREVRAITAARVVTRLPAARPR